MQSVMSADGSLAADPGVASLIPAQSHTFVEIDHEINSMVMLLPSAESFKKGCCQLQGKVQSNLDYSKRQGPQESFRIIGSSNDRNRKISDFFGKARMLS